MLKKVNASLGLAALAALLVHIIYEVAAFINREYNPSVTGMIANFISGFAVLHILCSLWILIKDHDRWNGIKYLSLNIRTVIQRVTAFLMIILIGVHVNLIKMLPEASVPLLAVQVFFFACVFLHLAVSFTNALITYGRIESSKARKKADIAVFIICALLFLIVSVVITRTEYILFAGGAA